MFWTNKKQMILSIDRDEPKKISAHSIKENMLPFS